MQDIEKTIHGRINIKKTAIILSPSARRTESTGLSFRCRNRQYTPGGLELMVFRTPIDRTFRTDHCAKRLHRLRRFRMHSVHQGYRKPPTRCS